VSANFHSSIYVNAIVDPRYAMQDPA